MKIPHAILIESQYKSTPTDIEFDTILLISFLHHYKKINDEKLKAMFKSLREGKLLRRINTYHCKINGKWYNDESMSSILLECYHELCPKEDMTLEAFLKYLNLYYNKNKNYCIDVVYFSYIEPFIERFEQYPNKQIIKGFGVATDVEILTFEQADDRYDLSLGFCCEDCDGDERQYKENRYQYYYYEQAKKDLKKKFKQFLLNKKNPSCYKNPNERLHS